jgi:hypothetical protein
MTGQSLLRMPPAMAEVAGSMVAEDSHILVADMLRLDRTICIAWR